MCLAPGSVDDLVVLNGRDPIFVEQQLTKLWSLKTRETVVAKGDGTGGLGVGVDDSSTNRLGSIVVSTPFMK
jgi:hypothetical protein